MRLWSSMVLGGALVLACGGSDEPIFNTNPDSSAGTGGATGSAGTSGGSGTNGTNGASGSSGSSGADGSGGLIDAATDGGSTSTDASDDSRTDGADSAAGTNGASGRDGSADGGGTDSGVGIGGPGKVVCGNVACDLPNSQCCVGFPISGCQLVFPPVCVTSVMLNCDDAQDCENGRTCCATVVAGNITGANCATSCNNGVVICNDSTRCPGNTTCRPFAGLDNYRTCQP